MWGFPVFRKLAHRLASRSVAALLAGPAVPVARNLSKQLESNLRNKGEDDESVAREVDLWDRIYAAVRRGDDLSPLRLELRDTLLGRIRRLPPEDQVKLGDIECYAEDRAERNLGVVTSKWGRFLVEYDPRTDQASLASRVLALYGGKDRPVPAGLNAPVLEQTFREAGKTDYSVRILDEANHLFQTALTGSPAEYEELAPEFVPGFLEVVETWIMGSADLAPP